jgi:hypothetical protein
MPSFDRAARSFNVVPITAPAHTNLEIEAAITSLGREPGSGLVVVSDGFIVAHRAPVILAAARNDVPAVYMFSYFANAAASNDPGPPGEFRPHTYTEGRLARKMGFTIEAARGRVPTTAGFSHRAGEAGL